MFSHRIDDPVDNIVIFHWLLLSFNGGAINSGGFLATGTFVSHVTGFATLFGESLVDNKVQIAFGILSVPFFFLVGAFIAGLLIDRPIYNNRRPHFDWVMGLAAFCVYLAAGSSELFHLGQFGRQLGLQDSYILLALLCLASGLQNGAISSATASTVRTTHLTGLTTDLGLGLSRITTFKLKEDRVKKQIRANYLRIGALLSFILGSAIGSWIFFRFGFQGFIFPALIFTYFVWQGRRMKSFTQVA